jgi:2-polyprenyl-3-methyl-5-hydroxy-6-metoxy-1,4-benzoquinol methylase
MSAHPVLRGLASSVRRGLRRPWPSIPGPASRETVLVSSPAAAVAEPVDEELLALFRELVEKRWSQPEHEAFLKNDLNHLRRYALSLGWIPEGEGRLLDPASGTGHFTRVLAAKRRYAIETPAYFNLERTPAPYPDDTFDGVLLMEVLEHFTGDPMFALGELNRILKPGGFLFLTTPNVACWGALHRLIRHESPYLYGVFTRNGDTDRHNREYTVEEVGRLVAAAGFRLEQLEGVAAYPSHDGYPPIPGTPPENRGDTVFCRGRKAGPVRDRFPDWLYTTW